MSDDNQLNDELNPTVPPGGLDTEVCPKRVWRSTSIPRDLTPDANNREGHDSKSGRDANRGDDEISSWPQREISQIRKNGDPKEVNPPSPPSGLDEACPKREFVPTSIPHDALPETLKSHNHEPTNLAPVLDRNDHHEPQPRSGFTMSPLDLVCDANNRGDSGDDETSSRLDPRKMQVAVALAVGQNETQAARLAGVHRTTVYRWQQDAAFVAEVNRQKREYVGELRSRLLTLLEQAIKTLDTCLERKDGDALKLKAAMFLVSQFAPQLHETIGPITEQGVKKVWDEAARLSNSNQVPLVRVPEP